jgi:carboxyl-terminal processing protease
VIEKIDGVYTRGRPLWHLALELADKQSRGEDVHLTVMDRQVDERREVVLSAAAWTPVHATGEDVENGDAGHVRLVTIDSLTLGASDTVAELVSNGGPAILDLRGLVWGLESEAIAVADLFVGDGVLARWTGREAGSLSVDATPASTETVPVVLVDHETEGVGEILAAALQRSGATLVGAATMGHAPHMQMVRQGELNLWIPVGRWLGPDDEPIKNSGLNPTEEVESGDDEDADPVLDRALELATGAVAEAA